ncbi:GNAT family N-acetyltransferase [Patescibacteria group bacterium]|nr:GNAT family N-acetyltransferase [Patescibacteria group bacterium]MCL5010483.1 GNAT family N-acetyltransferase [Patescibacteria group bacterium]
MSRFIEEFRGSFKAIFPRRPTEQERQERSRVAEVRSIELGDMQHILKWIAADPEIRKHLDPVPSLPKNWADTNEVSACCVELWNYYTNSGEPKKITPLAAVNPLGELLGVETLRWRGDPSVDLASGIASLERLIVRPESQRCGVGTTLVATALEYAFYRHRGYGGKGAREVRAWVMSDERAGSWSRNYQFFRGLGFQIVPSVPHWPEYAEKRGIKTDRDAIYLRETPEFYKRKKTVNPRIAPCENLKIAA